MRVRVLRVRLCATLQHRVRLRSALRVSFWVCQLLFSASAASVRYINISSYASVLSAAISTSSLPAMASPILPLCSLPLSFLTIMSATAIALVPQLARGDKGELSYCI